MAAPVLAKAGGGALVTDRHGWIAAASGLATVDRIDLPANCTPGRTWLPAFGTCLVEPLPGGWLVRLEAGAPRATKVELDVSAPRVSTLTITGQSGTWTHPLSPRHAEMLYVLACHRDGRPDAELAADLFGDADRTVTVRAEMSRLRRNFGGILDGRPYRFADGIDVVVHRPPDLAQVLPHSLAPAIRNLAT